MGKILNTYNKTRLIAIIAFATTLLTPALVRAETVDRATCGNFLPASFCVDDIEAFVGLVANWMVGIFGALFVLMIVVAGVQLASAGDSPDRLKAAKGRLINAVTGLVLLVSMRAILALLGITI